MDLLDVPLPELSLTIDIEPTEFFDQCVALGSENGWTPDRRREYAGPGYEQLNIHLGPGPTSYPMLRLVSTPKAPRRLSADIVANWSRHPLDYDEYLDKARDGYRVLLDAYKRAYNKRYRLGVPRRPPALDYSALNCNKIGYAAEKLMGVTRSLAIGKGDARERLVDAHMSFHVLRPKDLPAPLDGHLAWIYQQITKRPARHKYEGSVQAIVYAMRNTTAARVIERLVDLAEAVATLDDFCRGKVHGTV